jgi:hypothetical protein
MSWQPTTEYDPLVRSPFQQRELSYTQIVKVKNQSSDEEDWPAWSPIGVCPLDGASAEDAVGWRNLTFQGCRLDDYNFDNGLGRTLGITQQPIPYGKTGRVCIGGMTAALIHDPVRAGYIQYLRHGFFGVMVRKFDDRWTLRLGYGGDAKLVQFLSSEAYNDGIDNDQVLGLVDLTTPDHRVCIRNDTGSTLPQCNVAMLGSNLIQESATFTDNFFFKATPPPADYPIPLLTYPFNSYGGTCGWEIPAGRFGWGYVFNKVIPVCAKQVLPGTLCQGFAPGKTELYPQLPNLRLVESYDWTKSGDDSRLGWFVEDISQQYVALALTSLYQDEYTGHDALAYFLETYQGSGPYDGITTVNGITLPEVAVCIGLGGHVDLDGFGHGPPRRSINVQPGHVFRYDIQPAKTYTYDAGSSSHRAFPTAENYDDPVGTIRIWVGYTSLIPMGWRLCDGTGGTVDLRGRFIMGVNTAAGAPGDEDGVGDTGGSRSIGPVGSESGAPVQFAASSTKTDNRPLFYVAAYIQRVEPWTPPA